MLPPKFGIQRALIGCAVALFLFGVYWLISQRFDPRALLDSWPVLVVVTGIGGFAGWIAPLVGPRPTDVDKVSDKSSRWLHRLRLGLLSSSLQWLKTSPALRRWLKPGGGALKGETLYLLVHPDDVNDVDRAFLAASLNKARFQARCRIALTATQHRHVLLKVRPLTDANGRVVRYLVRVADATGQVRAEQIIKKQVSVAQERLVHLEQDLARLKESYRDLYHNAPVMYFSLDAQGRLVTVNDTLLQTLGYERAEVMGRSYTLLWSEGAKERPSAAAIEREWETHWRKRDGAQLNVWIRTVPLADDAGRFVRLRGAALDLTDRSRLAIELQARGDELERTNTRLRQINTELEDFNYVVSHDLKEPLRTLQAYSHLLAEDFSSQLGPDGFQYINHMIQASRRLGELIDDLLKLSQAGRFKGAPQEFDLIEVVATVRNDLVGLIQQKEASVLTEGSLPALTGDQPRIAQLLANLVANGLKYNRNPAPKVVIGQVLGPLPASAPVDVDHHHAVIYVRDNGIGIDPKHHQQIFGIFRRLHQTDEFEGTGAGLAICQKIVQAHGGKIWVESQAGQGATFFFTLPRPQQIHTRLMPPPPPTIVLDETSLEDSTKARHTLHAVDPLSPHQERRGGKPLVLLVEDQEDVGVIIQRLGERSGLQIVRYASAEEAWHYLQTNRPHLLLLDINLPGMNGIALCRKVRRELRRTDVPIVLFSPEENPAELEKLRTAGATDILSKDLLSEPMVWQQRISDILRRGVRAASSE
ncbi:MAG: ATP-binding protein [Gemmataceae bacterium]|nr:ATP-binding protein [Gemmataceae bacterium]